MSGEDIAAETPQLPPAEIHLVFVVHGMGQRRDKLKAHIATQQANAELMLHLHPGHRLVFVPIEWHHHLHSITRPSVRPITLATMPWMRLVCNEYLADVVYYFTRHYSEVIITHCINKMNQIYRKYTQDESNFKGSVLLWGHSLGGVVLYDILAHQVQMFPKHGRTRSRAKWNSEGRKKMFDATYPELEFEPAAFYALGSPIPSVLVMRNQLVSEYHLPPSVTFFNIIHPHDPLAYRYEPLVDERFADVDPVVLPTFSFPSTSSFPSLPTMPNMPSMPTMPESISNVWSHIPVGITIPALGQLFEYIQPSHDDQPQTEPDTPSQSIFGRWNEIIARFTHGHDEPIVEELAEQLVDSVDDEPDDEFANVAINAESLKNSETLSTENQQETSKSKRKSSPDPEEFPTPNTLRHDFQVKVSLLESMSSGSFTGIPAHFSYWSNRDVICHIFNTIDGVPKE